MNRRTLVSSIGLLAVTGLAACGNTATATTNLEMVKTYVDDGVDALTAAAQVYLASSTAPETTKNTVQQIMNAMASARVAFDKITVPADARSAALEILGFINQLTPLLTPQLGSAAPYIPLVIAVIGAFVNQLPPPASATTTPPAALHRMAMSARR